MVTEFFRAEIAPIHTRNRQTESFCRERERDEHVTIFPATAPVEITKDTMAAAAPIINATIRNVAQRKVAAAALNAMRN